MIVVSCQVGCDPGQSQELELCVCVSVADTCVDYTLYPVRQLTPVSLEYEEHVNVFVSGSAVFLMLFVCYLVECWTHLAPDIQSM